MGRRTVESDIPLTKLVASFYTSYPLSLLPKLHTSHFPCCHKGERDREVDFNINIYYCKPEMQKERRKGDNKTLRWAICMAGLFEFGRERPGGNSRQLLYCFLTFSLVKRNIQIWLLWTLTLVLPVYHYATNTGNLWLPVMSRCFKTRVSCRQGLCKAKTDKPCPLPYCFSVMGWIRCRILLSVSIGQIFQFQPSH